MPTLSETSSSSNSSSSDEEGCEAHPNKNTSTGRDEKNNVEIVSNIKNTQGTQHFVDSSAELLNDVR